MRAPLWLASLLTLGAHVISAQATSQPQQQPHRRLEGSTTATGAMSAHPPFRLFQALSTRYEVAAEESQVIEVSALSSNVFSRAKSNVVANEDDGGDEGDTGGEEPTGDGDANEDGGGDDGYNFVVVRTHKPVPECTPRPSRVTRTPTIVANDEDDEGDRIEVSSEQDSLESPAANIASEASDQSDSDTIIAASAGVAFQPLSSANFTTSSSVIVGLANSSANATSSEAPGSNSSVSAGDPPKPTSDATSSSPASLSSPEIGNSDSGSVAGTMNQLTGGLGDIDAGDSASDSPVSAGFPENSTRSALVVSPTESGIASNSSSPCIPMSVEGDATYCVAQSGPKSESLSCSGVAAPTQASTPTVVSLTRTCPRKGDAAIDASCHPHLRSFNATTKSCVAPEDARCIVIRTGVWGCSFSFSPSLSGGHNVSTSAGNSSSIAVQILSTATSGLSVNQTSKVIEVTVGEDAQHHQNDGSTVPGSLVIVTGVLAIALAVLAIVKRKRAQRKAPDQDAVVLQGSSGTYLSYPKTPEMPKATESMNSFT